MLIRRLVVLTGLALTLGGCAAGIAELNQRPNKYYEQPVSFSARVSRMQALPGETLLELADAQEHRIFVRAEGTIEAQPDDWVKVSGVLVPESRVGGKIVYDIVRADSVTVTRAPWLRNLY